MRLGRGLPAAASDLNARTPSRSAGGPLPCRCGERAAAAFSKRSRHRAWAGPAAASHLLVPNVQQNPGQGPDATSSASRAVLTDVENELTCESRNDGKGSGEAGLT